ncbi:MAG TPA: patatin-like phospholipase family protein [Thermoanaerobaculia bacterium]|nr:patatin-like phospholipase family protein [Thermoanaerobaculia bacterium]
MTSLSRGPRILLVGALAALLPQGCATSTRKDAVPDDLQAAATVPGFSPSIRYFPTDATHVQEFERDFLQSNLAEMTDRHNRGDEDTELPPVSYLAISGGGDNGAFGAGLLNGWTSAGTRPTFKLVTGVSTGALIAPFAFLGEAYDPTLKAIYTSVSLSDIAKQRSVVSIIYGDAMADTAPLRKLVEKYVTPQVLDAIAVEHARGRILLVATTNLDVRRPVVWNVTKIAASKAPGSLELVQEILVASAAIPGTFPPVMIDVEAKGKAYQEMHVDGGTTGQVFVYPAAIHVYQLAQRQRSLYIIRNARLDPQWAQVDRRTLPIAFRAITTLIQYQGMGDLYTIFSICQRDHVEYNLAYIPPNFDVPHKTDFDTTYMRALFEAGERMAVKGQDWWYKHPPVLLSGVNDEPREY